MNLKEVVKLVEGSGPARDEKETMEDFEAMGLPLEDLELPKKVKSSMVLCSSDDKWPVEWESEILDEILDRDAETILNYWLGRDAETISLKEFDLNRFWRLFLVEEKYLLYVSTDGKAEAGLILLNT